MLNQMVLFRGAMTRPGDLWIHGQPALPLKAALKFVARIVEVKVVQPWRRHAEQAAAIRHLSQLSDAHLADIGLVRSEIAGAVTGADRRVK